VNVQITENGAVQKVGHVADAVSCQKAGAKGWYYDDPLSPNAVEFCSAICDSLETVDGLADSGKEPPPRVDILLGCETEPPT